jgi:hypothetical protein
MHRRIPAGRDDCGDLAPNQIQGQLGQLLWLIVCPSVLKCNISAFDVASVSHSCLDHVYKVLLVDLWGRAAQENQRPALSLVGLLTFVAHHGTTDEGNEVSPSHSVNLVSTGRGDQNSRLRVDRKRHAGFDAEVCQKFLKSRRRQEVLCSRTGSVDKSIIVDWQHAVTCKAS